MSYFWWKKRKNILSVTRLLVSQQLDDIFHIVIKQLDHFITSC